MQDTKSGTDRGFAPRTEFGICHGSPAVVPAKEGVPVGVGWYLLGSPIRQSTWVNMGTCLLALHTLAAREGGGRLDHNSLLQLLKSFRHLMSFFGSLICKLSLLGPSSGDCGH